MYCTRVAQKSLTFFLADLPAKRVSHFWATLVLYVWYVSKATSRQCDDCQQGSTEFSTALIILQSEIKSIIIQSSDVSGENY